MTEQTNQFPKTNKFWSKISNILGVLAISLGAFYFIFSNFINVSKSKLEFNILTNTPLIEIKEEISKLNITYDSINIFNEGKNISIIIIEIRNKGNKSISTNDYDFNIPFGILLENNKLIKKPELIRSSDDEYFDDILLDFNEKEIVLKKKIIDPDEFFHFKIYSIHNTNSTPEFNVMGKISGQKNIKVSNLNMSKIDRLESEASLAKITTILSIALITILSLLTLALYKNNSIILKSRKVYEKENDKLIKYIENLEKKKKSK